MKQVIGSLLIGLIILQSCVIHTNKYPLAVHINPEQIVILSKASPFLPLTASEKKEPWGQELLIGQAFAQEKDFYRALTAFKRARVLVPQEQSLRREEIEYNILLAYYEAQKYAEVIFSFENTSLAHVQSNFPAYRDLLIILYASYQKLEKAEKADKILSLIEACDPLLGEKLKITLAIEQGKLETVSLNSITSPSLKEAVAWSQSSYLQEKKSPATAAAYNAILPGAGYAYVGQKQSAITSFLLNALFIAASYHFFAHRQVAAGIIFTSFELGWYLGGINGSGLAAKEYNEKLYQKLGHKLLMTQQMIPLLELQYTF